MKENILADTRYKDFTKPNGTIDKQKLNKAILMSNKGVSLSKLTPPDNESVSNKDDAKNSSSMQNNSKLSDQNKSENKKNLEAYDSKSNQSVKNSTDNFSAKLNIVNDAKADKNNSFNQQQQKNHETIIEKLMKQLSNTENKNETRTDINILNELNDKKQPDVNLKSGEAICDKKKSSELNLKNNSAELSPKILGNTPSVQTTVDIEKSYLQDKNINKSIDYRMDEKLTQIDVKTENQQKSQESFNSDIHEQETENKNIHHKMINHQGVLYENTEKFVSQSKDNFDGDSNFKKEKQQQVAGDVYKNDKQQNVGCTLNESGIFQEFDVIVKKPPSSYLRKSVSLQNLRSSSEDNQANEDDSRKKTRGVINYFSSIYGDMRTKAKSKLMGSTGSLNKKKSKKNEPDCDGAMISGKTLSQSMHCLDSTILDSAIKRYNSSEYLHKRHIAVANSIDRVFTDKIDYVGNISSACSESMPSRQSLLGDTGEESLKIKLKRFKHRSNVQDAFDKNESLNHRVTPNKFVAEKTESINYLQEEFEHFLSEKENINGNGKSAAKISNPTSNNIYQDTKSMYESYKKIATQNNQQITHTNNQQTTPLNIRINLKKHNAKDDLPAGKDSACSLDYYERRHGSYKSNGHFEYGHVEKINQAKSKVCNDKYCKEYNHKYCSDSLISDSGCDDLSSSSHLPKPPQIGRRNTKIESRYYIIHIFFFFF